MVTGVVALLFIYQLGALVNYLSANLGIADNNYTLKLSLFHTIFNLVGVVIMIPFINPMVRLLEKTFIAKPDKGIVYPKYLNDAVLEYPSSAIKALLDESKRIFEEPAFKIMSHALNLHREDIKSEVKPKQLVRSSKEIIDIDIDDVYYSKMKSIYSHILEFGTRIQTLFTLSNKKAEAINKIKIANRYIVEAIKDARDLEANVNKFMLSDNVYIQKEYDDLRKKLTRILREIYLTRTDENPARHLKTLDRLGEKAKKSDILIDGTLDKLIRKGLITSEMAISLPNDSNYVADICKHLIEAAKLLYIEMDTLAAVTEKREAA